MMLGRFGGGWKDEGRPLGRLACAAALDCWIPGGGAVPGAAEDMPGGGPGERTGQYIKSARVVRRIASGRAREQNSPRPGGGAMPGAPLAPGKPPNPRGGPYPGAADESISYDSSQDSVHAQEDARRGAAITSVWIESHVGLRFLPVRRVARDSL